MIICEGVQGIQAGETQNSSKNVWHAAPKRQIQDPRGSWRRQIKKQDMGERKLPIPAAKLLVKDWGEYEKEKKRFWWRRQLARYLCRHGNVVAYFLCAPVFYV